MNEKLKSLNQLPDLNGMNILVTGATGSFGKSFIKIILNKYKPNKLIVFSRDELKQFEMSHQFDPKKYDCLRYFIGDIRDKDRLIMAMRDVDIVIHAAAMKQVTTAEYNPFECVNTNVFGAENIVEASIHNNVKKVIALSTDKAVNPINLYGATKLAADKIFTAANHLSADLGTRFSVVRYGNVIGSRGSVIPYFKKIIEEGTDKLPITHPDMTRFWVTIEQGVNFVLTSLNIMRGCEVFVPKLPSMSMTGLAKSLAPSLDHEIIGIKPGEKLHETLISSDEGRQTIELSDRYVVAPSFENWDDSHFDKLGGRYLDSHFSYSSDNNDDWLDSNKFKELLSKTEI